MINFQPSTRVKSKIESIVKCRIDNSYADDEHNAGENEDKVICLGDIIGYGPEPNECIEAIFNVADEVVLGNHEKEVLNPEYQIREESKLRDIEKVWKWTANVLTEENYKRIKMLNSLSMIYGCYHRERNIIFSHGLPVQEVYKRNIYYLRNVDELKEAFSLQEVATKIMVVGHNHYDCVINGLKRYDNIIIPNTIKGKVSIENNIFNWEIDFSSEERVLISVPSVGQPRDGINYTGYAVLFPEESKVVFRRMAYDANKTYHKMLELDLPRDYAEILIKK